MRRETLREAIIHLVEARAILTAAGGVSEECNYKLYHAWLKALGSARLIEEELGEWLTGDVMVEGDRDAAA